MLASSLPSDNPGRVQIGPQVPIFYEVVCGEETPSYYCLKRDGKNVIDGHKVDVGKNELIYTFSIPEPYLGYLFRAVVRTPQALVQTFSFDGTESSVATTASASETLDFIPSPAIYQNDRKVMLRISGADGAYLESIKVYQFEIGDPQKTKFQGIVQLNSSASPLNLTLTSSIFNHSLMMHYSIHSSCEIKITAYDLSGRVVKKLLDKKVNLGTHTIQWDGRSDNGDQCPNGIYFIRLEAAGYSIVRKAMLIR